MMDKKAYKCEMARRWRARNPKKSHAYNVAYGKKWRKEHAEYTKEYNKKYRAEHREEQLKYSKDKNRKLRLEIIKNLGGSCACCGETAWEFLCLDHIHGGGHKHRLKARYSRTTIYNEVKREGFPREKYRILCWNCNAALGMLGYCPHREAVKDK